MTVGQDFPFPPCLTSLLPSVRPSFHPIPPLFPCLLHPLPHPPFFSPSPSLVPARTPKIQYWAPQRSWRSPTTKRYWCIFGLKSAHFLSIDSFYCFNKWHKIPVATCDLLTPTSFWPWRGRAGGNGPMESMPLSPAPVVTGIHALMFGLIRLFFVLCMLWWWQWCNLKTS